VKKVLFSLIIIMLMSIVFSGSPVLSLGIAMGPAKMEITNALRGVEYERSVTIFNPSDPDATFTIRAEGQASTWLSFYKLNSNEAIQGLVIPGKSDTAVLVKIKVPSDASNGSYTATIYAETIPGENSGDMGVSTILQAKSLLTVIVGGTQIIEGTVGNISTRETEAGFPLRIDINFRNKGNIAVQPQIDYQVIQGDTKIAELNYNKSAIKPETQEVITVEWQTNSDQSGDYIARVEVSLDNKILATKELPFTVLPPGTFSKQGEFTDLSYEGQLMLDTMLKIYADFRNIGEGDSRAKFVGEVYRDSMFINTIESEVTLIPAGQQETLVSYLKLEKKGDYVLRGRVAYEGKQTEQKEISFLIRDGEDKGLIYGLSLPVIIGIIASIVLAITLIVIIVRRKRIS